MIEQLLTSYVLEKLNKQIIKKIPYALFFALLINLVFNIQTSVTVITISSFVGFLIFSSVFNNYLSKASERIWKNMDCKAIVGKIYSIFEDGQSWLKDIGSARTRIITISGFISGLLFTITLSSIFVLFLSIVTIDKVVLFAFIIITSIYIVQDAVKANLLEEPESENKSPLSYDVMDTYLLKNSIELKNRNSRVALSFIAPIFGPLIFFSFPKTSFKQLTILYNDQIRDLLRKYQKGEENFFFRHEDGHELEDLFVFDNNIENINIFSSRGQKDILPYLFDPNYVYPSKDKSQENKMWAAFSIIRKSQEKENVLGHIFIHSFKGIELTTKIQPHTSDYDGKPKRKEILLIMILGQRSIVNYLETKITLISAKAPLERLI
jgi:hypothetical protein